jgi:hypothetical protein
MGRLNFAERTRMLRFRIKQYLPFTKKTPFLKCCKRTKEELRQMMESEPILTLGDNNGQVVEYIHVSCYLARLAQDDLEKVRDAAKQFVADIVANPGRIIVERIRLLEWHRKSDLCPICSHYLPLPFPVLDAARFHSATYSVECDWCPICGFVLPHLSSTLPGSRDYDLKAVTQFLSWEPWSRRDVE